MHLLLCQRLCCRAIVYDVQGLLVLEDLVKCAQIIGKALAGVWNGDLGVRPDPGALPVSLGVSYCGTQDDVSKDSAIWPSSRSKIKTDFPHSVRPDMVAECAVLGRRSVHHGDKPAIFDVQLCIHNYVASVTRLYTNCIL